MIISSPITSLDEARRTKAIKAVEARRRAQLEALTAPHVPERLDERHYASGHVWRRYAHEAVILRAKAMIDG